MASSRLPQGRIPVRGEARPRHIHREDILPGGAGRGWGYRRTGPQAPGCRGHITGRCAGDPNVRVRPRPRNPEAIAGDPGRLARRQVVHAFWSHGPLSRALFADFRTSRPSGSWDGFRTRRCRSVHGPADFAAVSVHDQARRGLPDFVHWRPCSSRGLYTGRRWHCTNPCWNRPSSAQSPGRRFRALRAAARRPVRCLPTRSAEEPPFDA